MRATFQRMLRQQTKALSGARRVSAATETVEKNILHVTHTCNALEFFEN